MIRSALTFHKKIHFNKSILTVVVLLSLLSYAGYIEAQDAPTLASATFFGGAGDQTAGSISVYGDKIFLTGNGTEMPDGITGDSIVLGYLDPPTSSPLWSRAINGANFYGIAASGDGVFTVGRSYTFTKDSVGGKEYKAYLAKFAADGTSGAGTGGSVFTSSSLFFNYSGYESHYSYSTGLISSVEGTSTYLYGVGFAEPCGSRTTFIVGKYDLSGNLIAKGTDSAVGINFTSCYTPSTGYSLAYGIGFLNGNTYVAGISAWAFEGDDKFPRPTIWTYDPNLSLLWRAKESSQMGYFLGVTGLGDAVYGVGYTYTAAPNSTRSLIRRFDEAGNIVWSRSSESSSPDLLAGITAVGNRLFAVGAKGGDSWLVEIDPDTGDTLSSTLFGGTQVDFATGVATNGTDLYVAGNSRSFASASGNLSGQNDIMLLRYTLPSFQAVRLIDTISTSNIDLDSTSFSKQPTSITADTANNQTTIEWQYDTFSIGQIEDLSFDVILKSPIPGEDRIVNHKLELLYTDVNGNPVRTELGPQSVHVLASSFTTSVLTDKTEYIANENAQIGLSITNLSEYGRTIDATLEIKDIKGNLVTTVKNLTGLSFVSGETKSFQGIIWNTGSTPFGDYMVHTRLIEGTTQVGEAKASFKIIKQIAASSKIVSDKTSYSSNETVTLTSTVTSQSQNSTITKPSATVKVIDPSGNQIFSETKNLPDLLPSARYEFKSFTNTGINPSGSYTATLEVRQTGELLSVSSTSFSILSSLDQAKALSGTIIVDPGTIFESETTTLTYTLQNTGNDIDLPIIQIEILIVDPDTDLAIRTMFDETSLNGREVFQNSIIFDSTGLTPKSYLVVLQGITSGITQALASTGLIVVPIPNSAPIANAGADKIGITGQSVSSDGSMSSDPDGDPISYAWHVESVPSGSLITDASLTGASAPKPSFIPDIEGTYILSLVVNDGLLSSQQDTVSVFVDPAPEVKIHPETINLKSNGGSKSITGVLSSPLLSPFSFFAASDGVTVTAKFTLENSYIDKDGAKVIFTVPQEEYLYDDYVMASDSDGNGIDDTYTITLKFNRDLIIAGFKDQNGKLKITKPTDLISTIIANGIRIASDTNLVILPAEVK